jgi:hypothetical protein
MCVQGLSTDVISTPLPPDIINGTQSGLVRGPINGVRLINPPIQFYEPTSYSNVVHRDLFPNVNPIPKHRSARRPPVQSDETVRYKYYSQAPLRSKRSISQPGVGRTGYSRVPYLTEKFRRRSMGTIETTNLVEVEIPEKREPSYFVLGEEQPFPDESAFDRYAY